MEPAPEHAVVYAERVCGDVVIEFNDGTSALYSAACLHSMLAQAAQVDPPESIDEEVDVSVS